MLIPLGTSTRPRVKLFVFIKLRYNGLMKLFLPLLLTAFAFGAEPILTSDQKLAVREAQLKVAQIETKVAQLESQYRVLVQERQDAQNGLNKLIQTSTPEGYNLKQDLTVEKKQEVKKQEDTK